MRPLISSLIVLSSLFISALAQADTTVFENGVWLFSGPTEFDDVIVGEGALVGFTDGVVIHGNLEIVDEGWCSLYNSVVEGNVKARGAAIIDFFGSLIEGNVDIKRTGGDGVLGLLPLIFVFNCTIEGNLKVSNNDVQSLTITGNTIEGKLELKHNSAVTQDVSGNIVGGKHCK